MKLNQNELLEISKELKSYIRSTAKTALDLNYLEIIADIEKQAIGVIFTDVVKGYPVCFFKDLRFKKANGSYKTKDDLMSEVVEIVDFFNANYPL